MFRRLAVSAFITSTLGTRTSWVTGAKSLAASNGIRANSQGLMACVATAAMPMVSPSGTDLATRSTPMLPPAPGLFSITTVPRASFTRSANTLAVTSMGPPGPYGTTMRLTLV